VLPRIEFSNSRPAYRNTEVLSRFSAEAERLTTSAGLNGGLREIRVGNGFVVGYRQAQTLLGCVLRCRDVRDMDDIVDVVYRT
jgi:hypothetical protein